MVPRRGLLSLGMICCLLLPAYGATAASKRPAARRRVEDRHPASDALSGLDAAPGMKAALFASEPMLSNPTNIDVDERGRVWVCEVVNYRFRNGQRKAGDRILILEDTNGDGAADKSTVFYQGRDIDSALGICVLGNRVIVSCSPNVLVFTNDGHDRVAKKELLFTKTGQAQHDHSAHAFVFGPDGRLYWNFGNWGRSVHDKNGKQVVDLDGHKVVADGHPYHGGMVFRCEMDGSRFEVLADNFRNNYEVAIDSFGTLWQSDNDDDGNLACRINYVMEYGNYGYVDEMTGQSWKTHRTNLETEIPARHWHQNDPGVVPNLLITGAGAPCGIMVYEGDLLPAVFCNQMIHTDAGVNIVRAYPVTPDGAGYKARIENMLAGTRDQWFRPVDVCAAPDGSLIVADWYDPGVGGHLQGDTDHGRLFRITTPGHERYVMPKFDFTTPDGAAAALESPNQAARYRAWTALAALGNKAEPALKKLWHHENPRLRARALWLLGRLPKSGRSYVDEALKDKNPDIRITGVRLARQLELPLERIVTKLVDDESPAVRRECAIALRHNKDRAAPDFWSRLASKHDGKDRWYLEALGIGADGQWDRFENAIHEYQWHPPDQPVPSPSTSALWRDVLWRSRCRNTPVLLALILQDPAIPTADLPRYLRAFDFQSGPEKEPALLRLALAQTPKDPARGKLIATDAIQRLDPAVVQKDPKCVTVLDSAVQLARGTPDFVTLVDRFSIKMHYDELLTLAQKNPSDQLGADAIRSLLDKKETERLAKALAGDNADAAVATATVLGTAADDRAADLLEAAVRDEDRSLYVRREAARSLTKTRAGALLLLDLAEGGQLDPRLKDAIAVPLSTMFWGDVKRRAAVLFPPPPAGDQKPLPSINQLIGLTGDPQRGHQVFLTRGACINCHRVGSEGKEIGPSLSEIGDKLATTAMFEAILYPSAGISQGYEAYELVTTKGTSAVGILVDRTADVVRVKNAEGIVLSFTPAEVDTLRRLDLSLMPADLQRNISTQDLVDLVAYLATLKKAK